MRTILAAFLVVVLVLGIETIDAQGPNSPRHDRQVSTCQAWRDQLRSTTRRQVDHGLLLAADATAVSGLIETMGQRCSGGDARRMSVLYAILLDTLVDQRNQP